MNTAQERRFTYRPQMYTHDGPISTFADEDVFRYEVLDEQNEVVGFITTDRARSHPLACWEISARRADGSVQGIVGTHETVAVAFEALQRELSR